MNKLSRDYLYGKNINIYRARTDVEVLPVGMSEKEEQDDLYIKVWNTKRKLNEFFEGLETQLAFEVHEFIACTDKTFTIRRKEGNNQYREETYYFSAAALSNSLVKERFDQYTELAKENPYYEEDMQEEIFARNISNAIYNRTSLDITKLQDIPEFKAFYERNKERVEITLRKRLKEKVWPEWLDFLVRYVTLLTINFAFLVKRKLPLIITVDAAVCFAIVMIDDAVQKAYLNSTAQKRMEEGIHNLQNRRLNGYSGFKNKVLKAIKTDIELTNHIKFEGYQEVLKTLYQLADSVLSNAREAENTNERTDKMSDVLNKLIDIEQIICIQMNYNGELNAEMLLNEYQGTPADSNTISIPNDEKRLLFQ